MVLVHAVSTKVLSGPSSNMKDWISAISQVLVDHHDIVQDKVCVIGGEVAVIVGEVEERNIIRKWKFVRMWKFSDQEAEMFASKLNKCVKDNLI
jgi:hypothetical protein